MGETYLTAHAANDLLLIDRLNNAIIIIIRLLFPSLPDENGKKCCSPCDQVGFVVFMLIIQCLQKLLLSFFLKPDLEILTEKH